MKDFTDSKYQGMTVNERLYIHGTMEDFGKAVMARDVERVKSILKEVELSELSITPILKNICFLNRHCSKGS